jgi:hypothetical protein
VIDLLPGTKLTAAQAAGGLPVYELPPLHLAAPHPAIRCALHELLLDENNNAVYELRACYTSRRGKAKGSEE